MVHLCVIPPCLTTTLCFYSFLVINSVHRHLSHLCCWIVWEKKFYGLLEAHWSDTHKIEKASSIPDRALPALDPSLIVCEMRTWQPENSLKNLSQGTATAHKRGLSSKGMLVLAGPDQSFIHFFSGQSFHTQEGQPQDHKRATLNCCSHPLHSQGDRGVELV